MNKTSKTIAAFTAWFFLSAPLLLAQAQGLPGGMQTLAETIYGVFQSDFTRIILAIFLCGAAVAYGFNKDNEKIKRNAIAVLISAGILTAAREIVTRVWSAAGGGCYA